MTNVMKIVGGGDVKPNLEQLGLKPDNLEIIATDQQTTTNPIAVGAAVILAIAKGVHAWVEAIGEDNKKREAFTSWYVDEAVKQYPDYNVVIIHTNHGVVGNYVKEHYELPMTFGTCGYEIYFARHGDTFALTNNGDGGYLNWAYNGYFQREDNPPYSSTITAVWG